MSSLNHKFELAARPVGLCKHTDWKFTESPVPDPAEGELLIQVIYISLDPAMRGWMNAGASYVDQEVVRELVAGHSARMVASRLGISAKTVEVHRANAYKKLGCNSPQALMRLALRHGLVAV